MTQTCANCRYWKIRTDRGAHAGNCLRYPPARTDTTSSVFPITSTETWCGEWTAMPAMTDKEMLEVQSHLLSQIAAGEPKKPDPKKNLKKVVDAETKVE